MDSGVGRFRMGGVVASLTDVERAPSHPPA